MPDHLPGQFCRSANTLPRCYVHDVGCRYVANVLCFAQRRLANTRWFVSTFDRQSENEENPNVHRRQTKYVLQQYHCVVTEDCSGRKARWNHLFLVGCFLFVRRIRVETPIERRVQFSLRHRWTTQSLRLSRRGHQGRYRFAAQSRTLPPCHRDRVSEEYRGSRSPETPERDISGHQQNAKPIAADLLLYIQKPLADTSIAQDVLAALNDHGVFRGSFQRSPLAPEGIKTASIIKFALRYLVSVDDEDATYTLYHYWDGDKQRLKGGNAEELKLYVSYCCMHLSRYFSWVKALFSDQWNADDSLLPSVVTINGFLIAFRKLLSRGKLPSERYFKGRLVNWVQSFTRKEFAYRSSQYNRFANDLIATAFSEGADSDPPVHPAP